MDFSGNNIFLPPQESNLCFQITLSKIIKTLPMKYFVTLILFFAISLFGYLILMSYLDQNNSVSHTKTQNLTLVKPNFISNDFNFKAGTSFILELQGQSFLITAHHLFGPAGGLKQRYTWTELSDISPEVGGYYIANDEQVPWLAKFISVKGASGYRVGSISTDIAIFHIVAPIKDNLKMSEVTPKKGDTVYLFAKLRSQDSEESLYHAATIISSNEEMIEYRFHNRLLDPRGTSGAPIINEDGNVVGMNLASAGLPLINWKGRGIASHSIEKHLERILSD